MTASTIFFKLFFKATGSGDFLSRSRCGRPEKKTPDGLYHGSWYTSTAHYYGEHFALLLSGNDVISHGEKCALFRLQPRCTYYIKNTIIHCSGQSSQDSLRDRKKVSVLTRDVYTGGGVLGVQTVPEIFRFLYT